MSKLSLRISGVAVLAALAMALPASASLGDAVSTVQTDAQHMRAGVRVTQSANYQVHEMQAAGGTVREYVSDGKVFGVAWQGAARPDLHQLLGSYYATVQQAVQKEKAQRAGRRPVYINQPGLVVEMSGHQRAFTGHAYIPNMMPTSVKAEEIR